MENDTLFFWIIFGVGLWVAYAWDRITKLRLKSEEQSRQIDDLKNQVAGLKTELEEKKVISWEKDKFVKDLDKHIEEITQ
jgi:16S rRNA C967 or C1407 C5-methylase (RsmB/RsmF family)